MLAFDDGVKQEDLFSIDPVEYLFLLPIEDVVLLHTSSIVTHPMGCEGIVSETPLQPLCPSYRDTIDYSVIYKKETYSHGEVNVADPTSILYIPCAVRRSQDHPLQPYTLFLSEFSFPAVSKAGFEASI
jgi:hypothetical protein